MGLLSRKKGPLEEAQERLVHLNHGAAEMRGFIEAARTFRGVDASELDERPSIAIKTGERVFAIVAPVALVEPRSAGGKYVGRSQGVSIKISKSVRYRVGASKGTFVRNPDVLTVIDEGQAAITDRRVVFVGPKQTREWTWKNTVAVDHDDQVDQTMINVSNRQKASGLAYGSGICALVRSRIDLAQAVASGTTEALCTELSANLNELILEAVGVPAAAGISVGSWMPDPTGRHELRFWSGSSWSEHVADGGVQAIDSL